MRLLTNLGRSPTKAQIAFSSAGFFKGGPMPENDQLDPGGLLHLSSHHNHASYITIYIFLFF